MQSWPALKYPATTICAAAFCRSASANTITGAFPPSSRCTFFTSAEAALATSIPARTDPVIETICGISCSISARPVSRFPVTTLNTPGGRCSAAISASSSVEAGVVSEGFRTMVFPAARAGANFQTAMFNG